MVMVLVLNLESQRLIIPMVRWLSLMMVLMISMVATTMLEVRMLVLEIAKRDNHGFGTKTNF